MYVALNRVTSLNGFFLPVNSKTQPSELTAGATQKYHRRRTLKQLTFTDILGISNGSFTFRRLNVHFLNKNVTDIKHDKLLSTNVICLTETQLLAGQSTERIKEDLPEFDFYYVQCER